MNLIPISTLPSTPLSFSPCLFGPRKRKKPSSRLGSGSEARTCIKNRITSLFIVFRRPSRDGHAAARLIWDRSSSPPRDPSSIISFLLLLLLSVLGRRINPKWDRRESPLHHLRHHPRGSCSPGKGWKARGLREVRTLNEGGKE